MMDGKQDQDLLDRLDGCIKTEPEIDSGQRKQNGNVPQTVKDELGDVFVDSELNLFEYQTTEQFVHDKMKREIMVYEILKIAQENVHVVPKMIKQEFENTSDVKVKDIKQEVSEYIQLKTESDLSELLTSHCDLPILKIESSNRSEYLGHPRSCKSLKHTAKVILKKKRRVHACPICQNHFPSYQLRSTHINDHFEKRYTVCQFCGKLMNKFEFFQHLFIHVVKNGTKHHINDEPLKGNLSSKEFKQKSIDIVDNKLYKCATCSKEFTRKSTLHQHLRIHSGEKRFKCDICSKRFTQKSHLQGHLIIHSTEKPFKCYICFKRFSFKSKLNRHLIIHSGKKSFKCDICSKGFALKSYLNGHLIIHSGKKSFKCDICSKGFALKSYLKGHILTTHNSENPFNCGICFKRFSVKFKLNRHLKIHSSERPFKCDICFKRFSDKSKLNRHLIIHSDEKPFKCDICPKGYTQKSSLKKHVLIHTGEKPFKGDICSKEFTEKSSFNVHLLIHSGKSIQV